MKAAGSSTSALASASGLSRTMATNILPPSFWIRAGRPACICARIATASFSHRVRFHSSRALCVRVQVCDGVLWAAYTEEGLSCSVEDGRFVMAATARKMSPSLQMHWCLILLVLWLAIVVCTCVSVMDVTGALVLLCTTKVSCARHFSTAKVQNYLHYIFY